MHASGWCLDMFVILARFDAIGRPEGTIACRAIENYQEDWEYRTVSHSLGFS